MVSNMRPKTGLLWLAFQLITVHVHAPREFAEIQELDPEEDTVKYLPESAVRFYPCYTTFSNNSNEHRHMQYRQQLLLPGRSEQRSVLVLKTSAELFVINLHLCESTHDGDGGIDLNVETKNNIECWQGTVNNVRDSKAVVIKSNGNLQRATVHYRSRVYIIESRSLSETTKNAIYIMYKESDLNRSLSTESAIPPCDTQGRERREIPGSQYFAGYPNEYPDEEAHGGHPEDDGHPVGDDRAPRQRCVLKLVADHTYFKKIGLSDAQKTRDSMIHQILRVNGILNLPFDIAPGLVRIFETPTDVPPGQAHFNMPEDINVTASELLRSFSVIDRANNHDNSGFCLAFLFTARTLEGGHVRGLANIGHSTDRGVCASTLRNSSTGFGFVLNGGLATSMLQGQRMLTRDSDLLVAHELAHSLGAQHDPDSGECSPPDKKGGPYLMSARPVSRYYENHDKLSICSIRQITIHVKSKNHCFRLASSCGNMKLDDDEQCDVGMVEDDPCCDTQCRLRTGAVCSDTNDLCCKNCQLLRAGTLCKDEFPNECKRESRCSGESGRCPRQKSLPNNSTCVDRGKCREGTCISHCEVLGMIPCLCRNEKACTRCCKRSVDGECLSIEPTDYLVDGTVCFNGFCQDRKCRKQVQDVIERIVSIVSKLSPSYVRHVMERYGSSLFIIILSLLWIPFAIWIHCHDERYYNIRDTAGGDSARDIVPLSYSNENIEFIDEDYCTAPVHKSNGDRQILKETSV